MSSVNQAIVRCTRCSRLRSYCRQVAATRKRQYRDSQYWGKPVPGFGDPRARLWIIGLAPAAHGANRTGRMFTGDSSGDWLYRALHETGFANQAESHDRGDGMALKDVYISAAGRCAPPQNRPTPEELRHCAPYLTAEWRLLSRACIVLALGQIGYEAAWRTLGCEGRRPAFRHNSWCSVSTRDRNFQLVCSYHPSRQNTNTGRLTREMWMEVFFGIRASLEALPERARPRKAATGLSPG